MGYVAGWLRILRLRHVQIPPIDQESPPIPVVILELGNTPTRQFNVAESGGLPPFSQRSRRARANRSYFSSRALASLAACAPEVVEGPVAGKVAGGRRFANYTVGMGTAARNQVFVGRDVAVAQVEVHLPVTYGHAVSTVSVTCRRGVRQAERVTAFTVHRAIGGRERRDTGAGDHHVAGRLPVVSPRAVLPSGDRPGAFSPRQTRRRPPSIYLWAYRARTVGARVVC
ncbi:hypothetical protein MPSYJ_04920 [Mycolicibacterium psychrotolerans]|uniref:Uncharacterized protein n=1 Tax=Mycolicibacterium psychrotolerans TaxID=216929 RepID=A0A7I7M4C7_9MYCO|nr:hypothetical protein MPSYJ_04920 [Mycolicibacterium psychrotolerans]